MEREVGLEVGCRVVSQNNKRCEMEIEVGLGVG